MSITEQIVSRFHTESLASNLRKLGRHAIRTVSKGGSLLGSYAVLPLDHRAVVSATSPDFIYSEVLQRIAAQDALYDDLIRRMRQPMSLATGAIPRAAID